MSQQKPTISNIRPPQISKVGSEENQNGSPSWFYKPERDPLDEFIESSGMAESIAADRKRQVELTTVEINKVQNQIRRTEQAIAGLGFCLFGEKRKNKLRLKENLKKLQNKLSELQTLFNWYNGTI